MNKRQYDIIVVGGGLAGLSFAILSAQSGRKVLLLEKGKYPRQKVCGEFISRESLKFMRELGLPIADLQLPMIDKFVLTSPYGAQASCKLNMGGIGISRYLIDDLLAKIAKEKGVELLTEKKVSSITKSAENTNFNVKLSNGDEFESKLVIAAFGRNSGLDSGPDATKAKYIGVKYHVSEGPADDTIEIHHFKGGYCGISKVEDDKYCLCYLAKASAFAKHGSNIEQFENEVLKQNKFLRKRLEAPRLINAVVTSKIQFGVHDAGSENVLTIGDAAGFIPPLTGNGMSLAFRASNKLHRATEAYFSGKMDYNALLQNHQAFIQNYLKTRINKGIFLQSLLFVNHKLFNQGLMFSLTKIPGLLKILSRQAEGKGF
jgi:flavin-dependent dehydrogenase